MSLLARLFTSLLLCFWAAAAAAQPAGLQPPDYDAWEDLASVAEAMLESEAAPSERFIVLRDSLADYRTRFNIARGANEDRIETLRRQISALGDPPENGTEVPEVAEQRAQLDGQLAALLAPVQVAEAAYLRADGLIGEVDSILRERQARQLLELGPSPLKPGTWTLAFEDARRVMANIRAETVTLRNEENRSVMRDNLPLIVMLSAIGLALIVRGRKWARMAGDYMNELGVQGVAVWRFLVSLLRVALPLIGLYLISQAVDLTSMAGPRASRMLNYIPVFGLLLFGFRWLAEELFARDPKEALIQFSDLGRSQARFYLSLISAVFVIRSILELIFTFEKAADETIAVVAFPIVVMMALALFGMAVLMRRYRPTETDLDDENSRVGAFTRAMRVGGTLTLIVSVVSPVMSAVGYAEAGNALLYPTVLSLVILGLVLVLQNFAKDVYVLITGQGSEAREALIPSLVNIVLAIASTPVLALAWGARPTDLTELWTIFNRGLAIGDGRISPSNFLTFALIFGAGYTITRLIQNALRVSVLPKTRLDIGGRNALVSGFGYIGVFLAALLAITGAGIDLSSIALVAGALSVGIGFGLQTIVSNFVSGIILLVERPISEGDWIEVGEHMGYVRDISVRSTRIETFERTDVIIPNADLVSGTVTNYTRRNTVGRLIVTVGVAYGTDTRKVDKLLASIAEDHPMVLAAPAPSVVFSNFGGDALEFEIRMFLRDVNWILSVKNDIHHSIAEKFREEGIEIPFAQRDLWLRNAEVLNKERS